MNTKSLVSIILTVILFLIIIGFLLPILISAQSTELVIFGVVVIVAMVVGIILFINDKIKEYNK